MRNEFLNVKQAAHFLGVTPNTIRAWANQGKIPYYKMTCNRYKFFRVDDLKKSLFERYEAKINIPELDLGSKNDIRVQRTA